MNPKHYHGEPCEKCRGTLRYKSTRNWVPCLKLKVAVRRALRLPVIDNAKDLIGE